MFSKLKESEKVSLSYESKEISITQQILLISALTALGVFGRAVFQWIPSVEPILPMAVALSFFKDWKRGSLVGVSSFFASNFFVWGWQGPWTIFQCLGVYLACLFSGYLSKLSTKKYFFFGSLVLGTIIYEISVNLGSVLFFPWSIGVLPLFLMASLPFGLIHIISSIGFGSIAYAFKGKIRDVWEKEVLNIRYFVNTGVNSNSIIKHTSGIKRRKNKYFIGNRERCKHE